MSFDFQRSKADSPQVERNVLIMSWRYKMSSGQESGAVVKMLPGGPASTLEYLLPVLSLLISAFC